MSFDLLRKSIEKKQFSPIYYLIDEEGYFVDKLTDSIDSNALEESERDFNRDQFFGGDANVGQILSACRSYPVMANRRLVIVKEAHQLAKKDLDKFTIYFQKPLASTLLVLAFKGAKTGLPKAAADAAKAAGAAVLELKKMYEKDVIKWVAQHLIELGLDSDPQIADLIVASLGTNLFLIENELEKIRIYLQAQSEKKLTKAMLFEMVNIDKEFNVFELIAVLAKNDASRAYLIMDKLSGNTKLNSPIAMIGSLYNFFSQLALCYSHKAVDVNSIKDALGVNYYAAMDLANARKVYPLAKVYRVISHLQDADLQLKGIVPTTLDDAHILKTLTFRILNQ